MTAQAGLGDFAEGEEADQTRLEQYNRHGYVASDTHKAWDAAVTLTALNGDIPPINSELDDRDYPHFALVLACEAVEAAIVDALREGGHE